MVNFFSELLQSGQKFFKQPPSSVIGVDIGSSSIKVVQLCRKRGVAVLETYGEIALGPYADLEIGQATVLPTEKIIRALLDVMSEANVTSRTGGVSIPFTSSLVTMISLPSLSEKQLKKMIPLEARKYIPVPINEVSLDWFVVPDVDDGVRVNTAEEGNNKDKKNIPSIKPTNVLLVAIHNDVLSVYQTIIEGASLAEHFFEIEIFSSIRAVIGQTLSPIGVLDIGAGKTKLYIVEYGVVKVSHLINRGSQDLTLSLSRSLEMSIEQAEKLKRTDGLLGDDPNVREAILVPLGHIFSEVNRVLLSYGRKNNRNIGRLVLTGGGSVLKGLLPLAKEKLETDVILGDPFAKTDAPAFLEDVLQQVGPEFSVAVGLALRKLQETS